MNNTGAHSHGIKIGACCFTKYSKDAAQGNHH